MPLSVRPESQGPSQDRVASIDPGVRTFATVYDPEGEVSSWGAADMSRIYRLAHAADDLQSRWTSKEVRARKRWRMKRAAARIRQKIRNLVRDLHHKFSKCFVPNSLRCFYPSSTLKA
jgi:putative transposase